MFDQATLAKLEANYQATQKKSTNKKQPQKKKNLLTALLPSAGSTAGATAGMTTGAALGSIVPGIGTVIGGGIGAIAGGFLGGFGGKVAENKLEGESLGKDTLKEAGLGAAFSLPGAGLIKGAKVANDARIAANVVRGERVANAGKNIVALGQNQTARSNALGSNVLALGKNQTENQARNIGSGALSIFQNQGRDALATQAANATRFNDSAAQTIQRLTQERKGLGLPLANGGGVLSRPGQVPSFASEGIERATVPNVPARVPFGGTQNKVSLADQLQSSSRVPLTQSSIVPGSGDTGLLAALNKGGASVLGKTDAVANGTNKLQNAGLGLRRSVANTVKVSDSYGQEKEILDALQRNGLKGSAANQYKNVDTTIGSISKNIDDRLATIPASAPRESVIGNLQRTAQDSLPADAAYHRELNRSLERLTKSGSGDVTPRELFTFKKDLGNRLGPAFTKLQKGSPLTSKEEVDMAVWRNLDDEITKLAPDVKQMTLDQSKLITARPGLQASSEKTIGVPLLGIKSKTLSSVAQKSQDTAGRLLSGAGNKTNGILRNPMSPLRTGTRETVGRGLVGALSLDSLANGQNLSTDSQIDPTVDTSQMDTSNDPGLGQEKNSAFDPITVQNNIQQILNNGGSIKDANDYLSLVKSLQELSSTGGSKGLNSTAAGVVADTETGLSSLQQLVGKIQDSNANNPGIGQLRALNPFDTTAQSLQADISTARQIVGKALEGGVLRKEDEVKYAKILPTVGDTDQVAQYKIQALTNLISQRLNEYKSNLAGGSGGVDTASLGI